MPAAVGVEHASRSSCSGLGQLTSSSSSIRSSYSMPSAFISATASPRALNCCAESTGRGSSRVASMTETTSSAWVGESGSSTSNAASAKGESGWFSANPNCRSSTRRTIRPSASGDSSRSTTPAASSER